MGWKRYNTWAIIKYWRLSKGLISVATITVALPNRKITIIRFDSNSSRWQFSVVRGVFSEFEYPNQFVFWFCINVRFNSKLNSLFKLAFVMSLIIMFWFKRIELICTMCTSTQMNLYINNFIKIGIFDCLMHLNVDMPQ